MSSEKPTFSLTPIDTIATENVKPNFASLLRAQSQLNANARSVHSSAGTGRHGHLVLTMAAADYAALTGNVDHPVPGYPGPVPIIAVNATAQSAASRVTRHKADLVSFTTYHALDNELRKQLIAACPDIYITAKYDQDHGYGEVTTRQLLKHLWDTYGTIKREDLKANHSRLLTPWHPTTPIEVLYKQIDDANNFATRGGAPLGDANITMHAYDLVYTTGVFTVACKAWRDKTTAEQTFVNFKLHFADAYNDLAATTESVGFHTANAVHATPTARNNGDEIAALQKKIAELSSNRARRPVPTGDTTTTKALTYCHTHGFSKNGRHTSATCIRKGPDHKDDATADNMMGGSTRVYTAADVIPRA
jgi:hypothetical protein